MRKTLRLLVVAAVAAMTMVTTNAMAQDDGASEAKRSHVSANGSYQFKPSWGFGIQYGLTFTDLDNINEYFLIPARQNYFDVKFVASHELYGEWSPIEGFRLSVFAGYTSAYTTDTGFNYIYGGVEPTWAVRRSFYEFAAGLGLAYGGTIYDSKNDAMDNGLNGHGLMVRPFAEARFYIGEMMAVYLRIAYTYFRDFGAEATDKMKEMDVNNIIDEDKLEFAGPTVALGLRFGNYENPYVSVGDSDGDGILDDVDECPDDPGTAEYFGCTSPDSDGDGKCDPWVSQKSLLDVFSEVCSGIDQCAADAEDVDGFEDEDGCPDPDNDKDGVCDPWVAEQGLSDKYADVCSGSDQCLDEAEDKDGNLDGDGCADPDNDGDGLCDPWVSEQGLSEKYADVCKDIDYCPNKASNTEGTYGCGNPDPDEDNFCDKWVYDQNLADKFPQCTKGVDECPLEAGKEPRGCKPRRVEVTEAAIQINDAINFDVNKATIKKDSDTLLEEIANVFKENPQIKKVSIEGHTDLSGNAKKNQTLSENRAKAVMERLVKLGVEPERMTSAGYGSSRPVEPLAKGQKKETKEQAAKNRRVEFNIVEQDVVKKVVEVAH